MKAKTKDFEKKSTFNKPKWGKFKRLVVDFIKNNNGIASMSDVYELSGKAFSRAVWSTPRLEEMAHYLVSYGDCFRIDLTINNPKPLQIYPGHHKLSSTTFFVLNTPSDDHMEDVEKAKTILNQLTEDALKLENIAKRKRYEREAKRKNAAKNNAAGQDNENNSNTNNNSSTKPANQIDDIIDDIDQFTADEDENANENSAPKKVTKKKQAKGKTAIKTIGNVTIDEMFAADSEKKNSKYRENQFRSKECLSNGFIPMKRVQNLMIQLYIFETFGFQPFTVKELINKMSFDMFAKVIGVKEPPKAFLKEPRLRHILIECFPTKIQEQIDVDSAKEILTKLLSNSSNHKLGQTDYSLFQKVSKSEKYKLAESAKIDFFGQSSFEYNFKKIEDIQYFHEMIKEIELFENIDPHSNNLWQKRYSLVRPIRNVQTVFTRAIVSKYIHDPYILTFPFTYPAVEKFTAEQGQNWANMQTSLLQVYNRFDHLIRKCRNPSSGPVAEFCDGTAEFQPNPNLYFDDMTSVDFSFLLGFEKNVIFNYLAAIMQLMPCGLITNLPRPWAKSMSLFTVLTGISKEDYLHNSVPQNLNNFLLNSYRDYKDLNMYTVVHLSSKNYGFPSNIYLNEPSHFYEITTSQYFQRFHIDYIRLNLSPTISELIERLKIILLTPKEILMSKDAKTIISEIDNSQLHEAVFYLKMTRFLTQSLTNDDPEKQVRYSCTRRMMTEFTIHRPMSMFESIKKFFKISQDANNASAAAESNSGAVAFLLDPDITLKIVLEPSKATLIDPSAVLLKLSKSSMTVTSKKSKTVDNFAVKAKSFAFPPLPNFEVEVPEMSYEEHPYADFSNYNGDICHEMYSAYMQLFVLIFQKSSEGIDLQVFVLLTRLIYSFVLHRFSTGVSLDIIVDYFSQNKAFNMVNIFLAIHLLEQFDFIYRLNITSVMPQFVSDVFAKSHFLKYRIESHVYQLVRPHLWTSTDGSLDENMLMKLHVKLAEIVDNTPGIEFLEIASKMTALTLNDLYQILDVLELDEVIYSRFDIENEGGIFQADASLPSPAVDNTMFFYELAMCIKYPDMKPIKRYFYPTQRNNLNLAIVIP